MQIQRVGARADAIVKTVEHYLCDQYSAALLKDAIELALKEQDKLTRHAIAESLVSYAVEKDNILASNAAERIAMNTSAL